MNTAEPRMSNLFKQLGLDDSDQAIADFIVGHQLPTDVVICDAPFWDASQRQFIVEQMKADAPWALIIDALNESLHEDATKAKSGL
ncbi:DUF2789 domain-containing protein [Lampropedia puyangensis]|uniref:DUF2789 domain-containing protein n=1 Tax=Lampropedia puyangensis TaxID=1330072 RepID=A0A4S8F598_9BURK|nr:DUF2789 domain-containing protein [Lampropedia puyangensis]THU02011.1 DUF2789 domain-containing protein [Lampropedia puyangensis]